MSLSTEIGPCLLLHSLLSHKIVTFGSNTLPRVPTTGSQEGVGMESMRIPANCESMMVTPSPVQTSLSLWSSAMCGGKVSVPPSVKHLA